MPRGDQVGAVSLGVNLDSSSLSKQANNLKKDLEPKFSGMAKKIGGVFAAGLSVKALVGFSKKCLDLGSDLAEVQNVVDVTFPAMSKQVDDFAQNAAASFGLSETMAKQFTGTFGAMSKAFGFAEKDAYEMSTTLTGLAGDVASFYNLDQEEAFSKLKSIFTGETEGLKSLGVVMTQTSLDQFAMNNGFGKTTAAMSEQEKVALRYQYVLDKLSLASGDFSRTSDGWANQVRLLKLQFDSLSASIGQSLIAVLTPAIQALNKFMGALVKAANTFKSFVYSLMGKESEDMTTGSAAMASALGELGSSSGEAADGLGGMGDAAGGAAKDASAAAKDIKRSLAGCDQITKLSDAADGSSGGSGGGAGSGGGISGLGDTTSALQNTAYDVGSDGGPLDKILSKLSSIKDIFKGGLLEGFGDLSVLEDIQNNFAEIGKSLKNIFTDENVMQAASEFGSSFIRCLGRVVGSFASIGATIVDNITGGISKYLSQDSSRISGWLTTMLNIGTEVSDLIGEFTSSIADIFSVFRSDDAKQITADIISIFSTSIGGVTELAAKYRRDIFSMLTKPITENKEVLKQALEDFLAPMRRIWDGIREAWQFAWDGIHKIYDEHIKPYFDSIKNTFSKVVNILATGWSTYVAPVLDALSKKVKPILENQIKPAIAEVQEFIGHIIDALRVLWNNVLDPVISWIASKVMPVVAELAKGSLGLILDALKLLGEAVKDVFKVVNVIITGEAAKKVKTFLTETVPGWIDGLKERMGEKWELIKLWITDVVGNGTKQAFINIGNAIIGVFNDALKKVMSLFSDTAVGRWIADKLGLGSIEEIQIPLIADLDPPAGEQYKNYKKELEKKNKKNPIKAKGEVDAEKMNDHIPDRQKTVSAKADFNSRKDSLTANQRTLNTTANYNKTKDSRTESGKSLNTTANYNTTRDSRENKSLNTTANYNRTTDSRPVKGKSLNVTANATSMSDSVKSKIIDKVTANVTVAADNIKNKTLSGFTASLSGLQSNMPPGTKFNLRAEVMEKGGLFRNGSWRPIQSFAGGGSPYGGQIFRARENGNPELVGTIRGSTAVMNNDQIVASVSHGVAQAIAGMQFYSQERFTPHLALAGTQTANNTGALVEMAREAREASRGGSTREILTVLRDILDLLQHMDFDVNLDGKSVKDRIVQLINANTRATGICEIVV